MNAPDTGLLKQHLIDPEICIRCNTCEATCPVGAITHNDDNYVVDAQKCNFCMDCISPCPTGSIDNWRLVPRASAYTIEEQFGWEELPAELSAEQLAEAGVAAGTDAQADGGDGEGALGASASSSVLGGADAQDSASTGEEAFNSSAFNATLPPWSAAHAYANLYGPKSPTTATVVGNVKVNEAGTENETHHIVLDFGAMPFPVLEGQSIGVVPPGVDDIGRTHHARQYSIASARNGERPGYNNLSLTVKRVTADHQGRPVRGVCSNYLCELKPGDTVRVIGPFGTSFLMPNHPRSNIVICLLYTSDAADE